MKPAEDRYDVRRGIILCDAMDELSTVDVDIPNSQSLRHYESNSVTWQKISIHQRFISSKNRALTTLLSSIVVTSLPTFVPTRGHSISNALLITPQLLKVSLNILRPNRRATFRERLKEVFDFVFEMIVYHYALCEINSLALTPTLHKSPFLITYQ